MTTWKHVSSAVVFSGVVIAAGSSALAQTPPPADPPPAAAPAPAAPTPPAAPPAATAPAPAAPAATSTTPATPGSQPLPPVEVIQQQPKPKPQPAPQVVKKPAPKVVEQPEPAPVAKPKPVKKAAAPKPKPAPPPQQFPTPQPPPPEPDVVEQQPASIEPGEVAQGRAPTDGRLVTTAQPTTNPVNADSILPQNLQNYSGAATRIDPAKLAEERPLTVHEAFARVPGVVTETDDGLGRHSGIGIRGSNFRRSRKVLVMEDGVSINFTSYIDTSTHYTPPLDRIENIEIIRGTVFSHGPLNNHGVVNFQNYSPFGKSETVIKGALIHTEDALQKWGNYRHVRTSQNLGNFGAVVAYSGGDASGAWENERLRFNDFYGAIGWKGVDQDLTISAVYFRQRDDYDEDNFVGTREAFVANGHRKLTSFGDDTRYNTYNADHYALTATHNYYIDDNTTLSTRAYVRNHERNRFSARDGGIDDPPDGHMRGRERNYALAGVDSRIEFANRPFIMGMKQDIQAGARYEYQAHRRCTSFGLPGQLLDHDTSGNCRAVEGEDGYLDDGSLDKYEVSSFAAFIQSSIHVTSNFSVTPGVRFESYDLERRRLWDGGALPGGTDTSEHDHVLPGVAFAWEFMPFTTMYGGYHRGFAPHIASDVSADFPLREEVGDNFQIGMRSVALKGFSFDAAYFHSFIDDYQNKEGFTDDNDNNVYGLFDKVEINGFEIAARLDTRPFTGGDWNFFGQAAYTFTNAKIEKGQDALFEELPLDNVAGNRLPFAIRHYANLTLGFDYKKLFDASVTWTYRGDYFTNAQNSNSLVCFDEDNEVIVIGCGGDPDEYEMVGGKIDDVWLLSARANLKVSDQLTLFVSGTNLTDEFYAADTQDGLKPGLGRTFTGGFTLRFD